MCVRSAGLLDQRPVSQQPVVQACVLFIALSFVLINLAVDLVNDVLARKMRQS